MKISKIKIQQIREHARLAKEAIDQKNVRSSQDVANYAKHLQDLIDHPVSAMIAMRERSRFPHHIDTIDHNKKLMEESFLQTSRLFKKYNEMINKLYPKTKHIREYIVDDGRLSLEGVKKSRGYNFIDKLIIFLRKHS